jgi:MSHA biogenesis protein MshK
MAHDLMLLAGAVVVLVGAGAAAETLPDPTRPPAFLFVPADGETAASESARGGLVLQSVLIGPDRRTAIIGGRHLDVGDRVGEFTLVKVDATQVLLKGPEGSRTLRLFPDVDKRLAQAAEGRSNASRTPRDTVQP